MRKNMYIEVVNTLIYTIVKLYRTVHLVHFIIYTLVKNN